MASTTPRASLVDGRLSLALPHVALRGVVPTVRWRAADGVERTWVPTALIRDEGDEPTWSPAPGTPGGRPHAPLHLTVTIVAAAGGLEVRCAVRNTSDEPLALVSLSPVRTTDPDGLAIDGSTDVRGWQRLAQGWQSWSNARAYGPDERQVTSVLPPWRTQVPNPHHRADGVVGHLRSELVTAVEAPDGALVAGFVRADRQLCGIDVDLAHDRLQRLEASCDLDGVVLGPGDAIDAEPLLLLGGDGDDGGATALLERWADQLGARQHARVPDRPPSGWCSWYYYFTSVTAADMASNLAAIDDLGEQIPFDYVMVDDGHQARIGDWLDTNDKFPDGMASLASDITATGRDAGIWIAPFIADPQSALATAHPDWFVRRPDGRPLAPLYNPMWNRRRAMRVLDTTHPEVLTWLEEVARTLRHEWGYRILKLDFLYCAALPGTRAEPDATLARSLRRGLDAIRAGAGDDAFLLGCGCPLGPAVGVVDGMRIGSDVAPYWDLAAQRLASRDEAGATTRVAIRNTLTRAFLHQRLWSNDPDCVMVRTDRTRLTNAEVRSLVAAVGLTDGMIVSSDRLDTVPAARRRLLGLVHELGGGRPRTVDLLDRAMPELVVSDRADDVLVGVFSFADRPEARTLDAAALGLPDGDVEELVLGGTVTVRRGIADLGVLDAHDCRVLRFAR